MKVALRNKNTSTQNGVTIETAILVITDETLDTSQFNPRNTPGVTVSLKEADDKSATYDVRVAGRRNIGVSDVADAVLAALKGDASAIHKKLGVPPGSFTV